MKVAEHLLVLSNANSGDVNLITNVILAELAKAELTLSMVLSQVCDGASVMAGRCGRVQRLLQERENRKIPYVHCLKYQLNFEVVGVMSIEQAINDFLRVCGSLYNFFASPQLHFTT